MAHRQSCPPRTHAHAVCSALLDMSLSHPPASRASMSPGPASGYEFGIVRLSGSPPINPQRRPGYTFRPVVPVRAMSAPPPRRWTKIRASKVPNKACKPEHKWANRMRLGWSRFKTRLAARLPERGNADVPVSPDKDEVESEDGQGVDWVDNGDEVYVFLWDGYWDERDRDARSLRSESSASIPMFLDRNVEADEDFFMPNTRANRVAPETVEADDGFVNIMITPPSPTTPRFVRRDEVETPTPLPRTRKGTPTLFPPSNPRFYQ